MQIDEEEMKEDLPIEVPTLSNHSSNSLGFFDEETVNDPTRNLSADLK